MTVKLGDNFKESMVPKDAGLIGKREIYSTLWKCRDFEIDHVWQRAVFLSVFLLACYGGYGGLVIGVTCAEKIHLPGQLVNFLAFLLAFIGLIFSLVWIMMAKGSKAWYEHYENAIYAFEQQISVEDDSQVGVLSIHNLKGFTIPETSSWLWNTKGGAYSVAKINIVIGHISAVIWTILLAAHLYLGSRNVVSYAKLDELVGKIPWGKAMSLIVVAGLLAFWIYTLVSIKSSFLKEKEDE